jgi:isochorismate synthase
MELDEALRAASGPIRIASVDVDIDPLGLVRAGSEAFGWAGFYASPEGRAIGALGSAATFAAGGSGRLETIDGEVCGLPQGVSLLLGFSFDEEGPTGLDWEGFPSAAAVLPEVSVTRLGGRSSLTVALRPGSDGRSLLGLLSALRAPGDAVGDREVDHTVESRPLPDDWRELVGEAVASIGADSFEKVVLARTVVVNTPRPQGPFDLAAQLRDRYPECRIFGWQQGQSVFVGASPEVLITREAERFQLSPLAGSAPRGTDADGDRRFGDALLSSDKDRLEHSIVVEDAVRRLSSMTTGITHPSEPVLQRFATVQHLATPITGHTDRRLLDLAGALHPTAAVGGSPRAEALAFIAKQEGIDRGWYSGGIGWMEPGGDGELAIALRCALVRGDHAIVYAGNGIVDGSDPDEELAETRLKLRPMLDLLTAS